MARDGPFINRSFCRNWCIKECWIPPHERCIIDICALFYFSALMQQLRKADPLAKRFVILLLASTALFGALFLSLVHSEMGRLQYWLMADPAHMARRAVLLISVAGSVIVIPLWFFAHYFWMIGKRTILSREFPHKDCPVIRDTVVLTGEHAVNKGKLLQIFAFVLFFFAAVLAGLLGYMAWRVIV